MTILSVSDAAHMAGVSLDIVNKQIANGILSRTSDGVDVSELIRVYPNLQPLTRLKLREVKKPVEQHPSNQSSDCRMIEMDAQRSEEPAVLDIGISGTTHSTPAERSETESGTVRLLIRELEWNKELLEQTNQLMAKQLADQRSLIADQARRLDEKDRFWARQVEIAQSLLAAPAPRKKFLGIF